MCRVWIPSPDCAVTIAIFVYDIKARLLVIKIMLWTYNCDLCCTEYKALSANLDAHNGSEWERNLPVVLCQCKIFKVILSLAMSVFQINWVHKVTYRYGSVYSCKLFPLQELLPKCPDTHAPHWPKVAWEYTNDHLFICTDHPTRRRTILRGVRQRYTELLITACYWILDTDLRRLSFPYKGIRWSFWK